MGICRKKCGELDEETSMRFAGESGTRRGEHVRSWDLSHCKKEIWEWDWGTTGSQNIMG